MIRCCPDWSGHLVRDRRAVFHKETTVQYPNETRDKNDKRDEKKEGHVQRDPKTKAKGQKYAAEKGYLRSVTHSLTAWSKASVEVPGVR